MKSATAIVILGVCFVAVASGRSLQEAPAQAPAAPADAIVSILDASGAATAAVPVLDASILKVAVDGVTVVKPDGQAQAVLGLTNGNSTIWVQPFSAHSKGFITISQATGPNIKVSLGRAPAGSAVPGAVNDLMSSEVTDYRLIGR
ncbi:hypothetical protein COCSUDRAFT_62002 [Coccomyxa subellipsoidea C-169]|uniref:Uncharacterized protein n=1 Tax=Coccomyxa subellipsoidea (strain C-169) TaxID=574566 RepID=I0Z1Q4_COCSC|nr:hypothetical protein COCSUDRAFT_62002 [Coccomyxa subellipsoidea C-169]EIE24573.1 hypothetical protein COCSUDRAFT_62002 [Coccomyxa subellipsoidea C-169]|eukprot:XP_005649117.1 hypothetical protein COCSUDRAFT_62002 [Coccomyxa subellipsoidea C-169]